MIRGQIKMFGNTLNRIHRMKPGFTVDLLWIFIRFFFFRIKHGFIADYSFIVLTDNPLIRSKKIFSDFIRNSKNCVPKKTKLFLEVSWGRDSKILQKFFRIIRNLLRILPNPGTTLVDEGNIPHMVCHGLVPQVN